MKRRDFSAALLAAGALGLPGLASAQRIPREGVDYRTLARRAPTEAPAGKIEVVEFFWYSCPYCNAFEPHLQAWSRNLPADVVLRRVPVAFRDSSVPQQRLFYTLQAMGKVQELHPKVFQAIHVEGQSISRADAILDWAQRQGLDKERFQQLYDAEETAAKVRQATWLQDAYRVEGVPALGIDGRYYTDGSMAGTLPRALMLADYLVAEARKGR